jgi:hypothetical protein
MNLDELANRLVKCKHFRWMEGMLAISFQGNRRWVWRLNEQDDHLPDSDSFPDLADPATLGCLLHFVREAWRDPGLSTGRNPPYYGDAVWCMVPTAWTGDYMTQMCSMRYASEAEALVAALEAAP